jgi:hypothetical protein
MCSPQGTLGYNPKRTYPFSDKCPHRSTQLSHRGVQYGECMSHMELRCGILEATPSRNTRVNFLDIYSCALHKGRWDIIPNPLIPSRISVSLIPSQISVITDQLNSVTEENDLENVSGSCKHQHSLSVREAFSAIPSLSRKYSNFLLVW